MRRLVSLALVLVLAGPALAAPSGAPQGRLSVPPPPAAAKLRGALSPDAGPAPGPRSQVATEDAGAGQAERLFLPPPLTTSVVPPPGEAQACRLACAETYYFCSTSDNAADCPGQWAFCRAACGSSAPRLIPAPH